MRVNRPTNACKETYVSVETALGMRVTRPANAREETHRSSRGGLKVQSRRARLA